MCKPLRLPLVLCAALVTAVPQAATAREATEAHSCSAALGQPLERERPGFAGRLRLLSWNIQKTRNKDWDTDLLRLGGDRDLLLIQEATTRSMIADVLPETLYHAFAPGYTTESETTGVLTLSRVEQTLQCSLTAWEPWLGTPKATAITEYPVAGLEQRLLVVNLHAVNFTLGMEDFAGQFGALSAVLSRHTGPVVAAGDFNTWSDARQDHLQQFMKTHRLSAVEFTPDHRYRFLDLPLDYILLRGLRAVEASTLEVLTSDHNPLLLTVEIND